MDNYWYDPEKNTEKAGGGMGKMLLACFGSALLSAVICLGVCSIYFGDSGKASADTGGGEVQAVQSGISAAQGSAIKVSSEVSPAVVFISNIRNVRTLMSYYGLDDRGPIEAVASTGSGVIYSADGYIITNNHVVAGAEKISVTLYNGDSYIAEVVGRDARTDLAVIKIDPDEKLTVAKFGDSDKLVVGETAIAIGNPRGENFANSVTQGIISGLNRSVTTNEGKVLKVVQTDAAINPGNSGGALCNAAGEVIGINTVKITITGYEGMGFAIPSNDVLSICRELMENGKIARPALGVNAMANITPQISYYNDLSVDYGVLISPNAGGGAERAGLKAYDIIVAINGEDIKTYAELQDVVSGYNIGDTVKVTVIRDEDKLDFQVKLGELAD